MISGCKKDKALRMSTYDFNTIGNIAFGTGSTREVVYSIADELVREGWVDLIKGEGKIDDKIVIRSEKRGQLKEFMENGGYSKSDESIEVTNELMMSILQNAYEDHFNCYDLEEVEWSCKYSVKRRAVETLVASGHLHEVRGNKEYSRFELDDKIGKMSVLKKELIYNNNQIQIDMSRHNKFEGPTIYTEGDVKGDVNQDNSKKND